MVKNVAQWRGPEERAERKIGWGVNDIEICLCAEGFGAPRYQTGWSLGCPVSWWAVAAGRVWGPSLVERMRTAGHPVMAKTPHIGCALMTPLETETVWLLHDKMHCTIFYPFLIQADFLRKDW